MWTAASIRRRNMSIFSIMVAFILTIYNVPPIRAGIDCHEHPKGMVRTHDGKYVHAGATCQSSSSTCYESYVKKEDRKENYATYTAGCGDCKPDPDEECRTCKAELCNNVFAKKIKKKNLQCITNESDNEDAYGSETAHCAHYVKDCYFEPIGATPIYHAGCGKSKFNDAKASSCPKKFCNAPKKPLKILVASTTNLKKLELDSDDEEDQAEAPAGDNKPSVDEATSAPSADKENGIATKKPKSAQEIEEFYDNGADKHTVATCTTWTALSVIVSSIRWK